MVRVFAEVESPEPLDLMVVTHYADLAAMDRANAQLRRPSPDHPPVGELYQRLSDLSLGHHDQFVELISPPAVAPAPDGALEVLEFFRLDRSIAAAFERRCSTPSIRGSSSTRCVIWSSDRRPRAF